MSSLTPQTLFERFVALIYKLTEPYSQITDSEKRLSARLLAGIMLVLAAFMGVVVLVKLFVAQPGDGLTILPTMLTIVILLGLYGISRTQHYLLSTYILIILSILVPIFLAIQGPGVLYSFPMAYLTIAVLISSLVLSIGVTAGLALLVSVITILLTLAYEPSLAADFNAIYLNIILVGLITMVAIIRQQHQKIISQQAAAITKEHNLLRTLIEALPAVIYVKDRESRFVLVNQQVAEAFNRPKEAIIGKSDADFMDEIYAREYRQTEIELMETGQPILEEEDYKTLPNGEKNWSIVTKVPLRDESGKIIGLVGINRPINKRKQAEKALLEERNLLQTVIENIPDQIYIKDRESRVLMANGPVLARHGFKFAHEILGKNDFDLFPPGSPMPAKYRAQELRIIETGEHVINFEISYIKDGKQYWNIINKVPLRDSEGQIIGLIGVNRDITDRKLIEDKLLAERNLLMSIIENIPDPVYVKDRESRFLLVNRMILNGMGLNSLDDVVGKTDFDFLDAAEAQPYYDIEQEIMNTGRTLINQQTSGKDFERSEDSFLVTKVPLRDLNGQIIGIIGINRNINERIAMENDLAKERSLLHTLIETIPDSIYVKDTEGRFILANRNCWRSEGFASMEAMIGKTDFDFITPERAQIHWDEEQQIIKTGEPLINDVVRFIDRQGNISFVMITKVPLHDANGELVGIIGINRDINENIRTEIQMIYQSTLIENISDAVISTDLNFNILGWNPGAEKLYGWKAEETLGKHISQIIPVQQSRESVEDMRNALHTLRSWSGEVVHTRKDGSKVDIFSSVSLVYDNENLPVGAVGINHDITEQKVAEQQRLELAVERERVDILRRFIGDMSHDLRNPLATIKVSLYLLRRLVDNPARRTYHLDTLELQISRLENMVNDLLSMANLDSDASEFIFVEVDITQTVYEVVTHQESLAARREQKLSFEAEKDLPSVRCDEGMLIRAITNLVANALNYTPVGGEVSVFVLRQEENIHIRISDTGIGIDPADLPHIFERFYRADKARSTDTGGTGLGLSITQRIIEAHNGEITVESEPGNGSTFTIILPINPA